MKKILLILILSSFNYFSFSQNKEDAEKLVEEGVACHDKGNYTCAISKYDKALELDKDNLNALAEKAFTLFNLKQYDESIIFCQKALEAHSGDKDLKMVFVTYGNALDASGKPEKSLKIYDEGIKQFPDFYMLHYNKGITLTGIKKYDEAILSFQKAVMANPDHASSHNAMAGILKFKNKRVPALLVYCRFLVIEPDGQRAKENLASVKKILNIGQKKQKHKNIMYISMGMLSDTNKDGTVKENSFSSTELTLSIYSSFNIDKELGIKKDIDKLINQLDRVCKSLEESKKNNFGFYWEYYVPYIIEMRDKKMIRTFAYIALASSGKRNISKWLKSHQSEVQKFYNWLKEFEWKVE